MFYQRVITVVLALLLIPVGVIAHPHSPAPSQFAQLKAKAPGLSPTVLRLALSAYHNARAHGLVKKQILTVIDYSKPSSIKRMYVFDLANNSLPYVTLVAHGKGSGKLYAKHFSNITNTHETSIGTFITGPTYFGGDGYSLILKGISPGFNTNALSRHVVMHGAWYVSQDFAKTHGRLGLSWGCPAVSKKLAKPIIGLIKNGSVLFAYYPDNHWLHQSHWIKAH